MTYTLIILVVIVALLGVSLALGRTTLQAQIVRDDEFVELDGAWIRYRVVGEGPPVLLVHGILSSSRIWEGLASRLSERFTVYSLDLRGFGESDKPLSGYGVRHGSRLLYSFCSHFGLGNVALVGHDVGGDMVVKLAADHPEFVRSVTLVATPANEEQIDLPTSLWLATLPVIGPLFYALGRYVRLYRKLWLRAFVSSKRDIPKEFVEDAAVSTPVALRSTFNTVRREIAGGRVSRQAYHLRSPMLVIAGEEDQIVDPTSSETWSEAAPRCEVLLLDRCGHLPMIEASEEFDARLFSFLSGGGVMSESPPQPIRDDATAAQPPPPVQESGGIDGMEPDEEASAADPEEEPYPRRTGGEREPGYHPQDDETRDLGRDPHGRTGGETGGRESGGRGGSNGGFVPEIPDDLFQWSDLNETRRRGRGEDRERDDRDDTEDRS